MNYLLSIIIPTKNRQYYCLNAVKQIISHGWNNVEICIQDNSDDNALEKEIASLKVDSIIYNYHSGVLSFVDNFSEAVSLAHGEYLCMIGDDDGVLPNILFLVDDLKKQDADAAIPALNFIYFWPSNQNIVENSEDGLLIYNFYSERKKAKGQQVDNRKAIVKLLQNGVQNYTNLDMPRLYHGIVKRETLDVIKKRVGYYFGGLTPDMYMATALSLVCKKVIRVGYSVTISGICPTSGSSDSATGKHTGELSKAPHFRGHKDYQWEDMIPAFYSVDTIWADTLFHALKDFRREDLLGYFNKSLFAGICIEKYPLFSNTILTHALNNGCTICSMKCALYKYKAINLIIRVFGKIKRILSIGFRSPSIKTFDIPNIFSAEQNISELRK